MLRTALGTRCRHLAWGLHAPACPLAKPQVWAQCPSCFEGRGHINQSRRLTATPLNEISGLAVGRYSVCGHPKSIISRQLPFPGFPCLRFAHFNTTHSTHL
jgi:hypothetical protein